MPKEYKVTVDQSILASNSPAALEKRMNEMVQLGWDLAEITSIASEGSSAIYMFWQRQA